MTQSNPYWTLTFPESITKEADDDDDDDDEDDDDDDSEVKEDNGVLVLNDANFDTFTEDKDTVLLEFYAPWWVHSLWYFFSCRMEWLTGHTPKKWALTAILKMVME